MAIAECDPDLVKKDAPAAAPKAAAPAAEAPAAAPKPAAQKVTLAADALFDFNKATLRAEGTEKLTKLVNDLQGMKLEVIIAVGHADRLGSDAYNQKLSEKRAAAVKTFLVGKGIEPNRVYTEGKGEKQPVTKADQCKGGKSAKVIACLQPDRRVDIEVIGTK
jgi:OOP family OmpA-OmpF porin